MSDEEKVEEPKPEVEPNAPQPVDLIAKANEAADRLEKANVVMKELIDRKESLAVEKTLGGVTDAGQPTELKESDADYAKRVLHGEKPE